MIPVKLQISGFLSYQDMVEVDFNGFSLACISGSNGAGKSSLLDAITWVLFGNARRNDDAIINSHSKMAEVSLEFLYEGETYLVIRKKPRNKVTTLDFQIRSQSGDWKVLTEKSVRETEIRINETLKMEYETFINASFFLQGKADQFAQQKPGDRKRILGNILGLEKWEQYQKTAAARRKKVDDEIKELDGRLTEIANELNEEAQRQQHLAETEAAREQVARQRSLHETALQGYEKLESALAEQTRNVERMELELKAVENRKVDIRSRLEERLKEISEDENLIHDADEIEKQFHQWEEYRAQKEKLEALAARYHQLDEQRQLPLQQLAAERGKLQAEMTGLQNLLAEFETIGHELERLETLIPERRNQLIELQKTVETRPLVENEIRSILESTARLESENGRLKVSMQELRERIDGLKVVEGADCPLCRQPLTDDHRQDLLASLENEGKTQAEIYRNNQQEMRLNSEKKNDLDTHLKVCDQAGLQLKELQRSLDQDITRMTLLLQKKADVESASTRIEEIQHLLSQEKFSPELRSIIAGLNKQIDSLGYDSDQLDVTTKHEINLRPAAERRQLIAQAKSHIEPLKRETENFQKQLADLEEEINRRSEEIQTAQMNLAANSADLPDIASFRKELIALKEQETRLITAVGSARQLVQVLETLRTRKTEITHNREELGLQVSRYKALEKAFGKDGIQALLIEEALPEIETQANEILDRLSGGSMSVQFATQQDYKDKNREDKKETLDILISDGAGERAYELFSGGEAFRVNFAIRLALSRVLAHRAGARLQTLVIDEGFGSQDVDGRQRLIETINEVKTDFAKILVITHLEELKDAFPARIEVEKTLLHGSQVTVSL
jgi:exonuclease SbcC